MLARCLWLGTKCANLQASRDWRSKVVNHREARACQPLAWAAGSFRPLLLGNMHMLTSISIKGLQTFGYHGLFEEERTLGQKFLFDIHGQLAPTHSHQDDALQASIRYDAVVEEVVSISEARAFMTLEALGEAIARGLLTRFAPLQCVTVGVTKHSPPLKQTIQSAGIEVELRKDDLDAGH